MNGASSSLAGLMGRQSLCRRTHPIQAIRTRIPSWAQIIPVYGVIVLMVYTWTLMAFFYKVPSWSYYLNAGEILTLLAYSLATNLAETLLVLCGPLLVALILPRRWFRDVFI